MRNLNPPHVPGGQKIAIHSTVTWMIRSFLPRACIDLPLVGVITWMSSKFHAPFLLSILITNLTEPYSKTATFQFMARIEILAIRSCKFSDAHEADPINKNAIGNVFRPPKLATSLDSTILARILLQTTRWYLQRVPSTALEIYYWLIRAEQKVGISTAELREPSTQDYCRTSRTKL